MYVHYNISGDILYTDTNGENKSQMFFFWFLFVKIDWIKMIVKCWKAVVYKCLQWRVEESDSRHGASEQLMKYFVWSTDRLVTPDTPLSLTACNWREVCIMRNN